MGTTYLSLRWSVSRARDTYGYNVVTLTDEATGKRYKASGGGYDMVGTVFGAWLEDTQTDALKAWAKVVGWEDPESTVKQVKGFYGTRVMPTSRVRLDGACGIDCMTRIAKALGLNLERTYKRTGPQRGTTTGWIVTTSPEHNERGR